jgi:hypothetical protein
MSEILEKEISLSELGKIITTRLLLTNPCPYIITFVLFMKENKGGAKVKDLFDRYMSDTKGNVLFLEHAIKKGIDFDLFEFKK